MRTGKTEEQVQCIFQAQAKKKKKKKGALGKWHVILEEEDEPKYLIKLMLTAAKFIFF